MMAILSTSLEEVALAVFILWGLPRLGVKLPLGAIIGIMGGLATYSIISYRAHIRTHLKKPLVGFTDMNGSRGTVVKRLSPEGMVRIGRELWDAESEGAPIEAGEEVIVIRREGLKLFVRKNLSQKE